TGGPALAVRLHAAMGGGTRVAPRFEERAPRDPSYGEQEARNARAQYELARLRGMWWFPKDASPALFATHEEELPEYEEDVRVFRLLEAEASDQGARSSKLP